MAEIVHEDIHKRVAAINSAYKTFNAPLTFGMHARSVSPASLPDQLRSLPPLRDPYLPKREQYTALTSLSHQFIGNFLRDVHINMRPETKGTHITATLGDTRTTDTLPPFEKDNPTKSVLDTQRRITNLTESLMLMKIVLPALEEAKLDDDAYSNAQEYLDGIMGGYGEGLLFLGCGVASMLKDPLPSSAQVKKALDTRSHLIQALTKLNIFPQKVLDSLVASNINLFKRDDSGFTPLFSLRPEIFQYVESLGTIFSRFGSSQIRSDDPSLFKRFSEEYNKQLGKVLPASPHTLSAYYEKLKSALPATAPSYDVLSSLRRHLIARDVIARNFPFLDNKEVNSSLELFMRLMDVFDQYRMAPEDESETLECPVRHAGLFNPWYKFQSDTLLQWYNAEQKASE